MNNEDRNWLTYETLFNLRCFRKSDQRHELGLYLIPLDRTWLWVRGGIPADALAELCEAFFPDSTPGEIRSLSRGHCPWKPQEGAQARVQAPPEVAAGRGQAVVHHTACAVLPFNYHDNYQFTLGAGHAAPLGELKRTSGGTPLAVVDLGKSWGFWKTASRSMAVQLRRVKPKGGRWGKVVSPLECDRFRAALAAQGREAGGQGQSFPWLRPYGNEAPPALPPALLGSKERGEERRPTLAEEASRNTQLKRADLKGVWGVKAGARYIGCIDQGELKEVLDEDGVMACLRSDLIAELDRDAGRDCATDPDLGILTELLAITEAEDGEPGDGVHVRDFRAFDPGRIYFPPTSIPYVDLGLKCLVGRFACAGQEDWRNFWERNYAAPLGRAKAILLLRYGLQMVSPNAQNFLLEFEDEEPLRLRRVIIRDVGDMHLHREVLWARFGPRGAPPRMRASPADARRAVQARLAAAPRPAPGPVMVPAPEVAAAAVAAARAEVERAAAEAEEAHQAAKGAADEGALREAVQRADEAARRAEEAKQRAVEAEARVPEEPMEAKAAARSAAGVARQKAVTARDSATNAAIEAELAATVRRIRMALARLTPKVIQHECTNLAQGAAKWKRKLPYETGTIALDPHYGANGTRFLWSEFSTLATGKAVSFPSPLGKESDARVQHWRQMLYASCHWGLAHDRAYVRYLEEALGVELSARGREDADAGKIQWESWSTVGEGGRLVWHGPPRPERYLGLEQSGAEAFSAANRYYNEDRDWENAQAKKVDDFLRSDTGQRKLKAYYAKGRT